MSRAFRPCRLLSLAAALLFGAAPALAQRALSFAVPGDQIVGQSIAQVLFPLLAVGAGASGGTVALNTTPVGAGKIGERCHARAGTVRTGRYHVQSGTEDGFAAGP